MRFDPRAAAQQLKGSGLEGDAVRPSTALSPAQRDAVGEWQQQPWHLRRQTWLGTKPPEERTEGMRQKDKVSVIFTTGLKTETQTDIDSGPSIIGTGGLTLPMYDPVETDLITTGIL
ncbi:unnamed protein product [Pleuronectes platessa]|uniref:Uncharacterized protein n=1 Tax=Pleuronectes platessa TaxID=8262 RepID=A0A9N7YC72_PLEPL|nr:unnamed protein product [Pleuronectes platessa]